MLTLRIFLIDLIAFVPDGDGMWALLPDAREERDLNGTRIESHFPVVLFDTDEDDAGDWNQVKPRLGLLGPRRGRTWLLDREELRLAPGTQVVANPLSLGANTPPGTLPNSGNREDSSWIPRMRGIVSPAASRVDAACLASPTTTDKIVARMRSPAGRLRTIRFAGTRTPNRVRPFRFRTAPGAQPVGPARAIADAAVVDLQVQGQSVTLETVRLDGTPGRQFELTPRGNARMVHMLLGNLSPLDLTLANQTSGPHFDRYYDLAAQAPPQRPIPFVEPSGGFVQAIAINTRRTPEFLRQIDQMRLGGINRQICTFAAFSA